MSKQDMTTKMISRTSKMSPINMILVPYPCIDSKSNKLEFKLNKPRPLTILLW